MENNKNKSQNTKSSPKSIILYLIFITLLIIIIFSFLLFRKPAQYIPHDINIPDHNTVSPYLTNYLIPEIHNNAQLSAPFTLDISQNGLNDIISRNKWPYTYNDVIFDTPQLFITKENIVIFTPIEVKQTELILTVMITPQLTEKGLLNLNLDMVKVGAINITILARSLANGVFDDLKQDYLLKPTDTIYQLCNSLINSVPFNPTFRFPRIDRPIKITNLKISPKTISLQLTPLTELTK